MKKLVLSAFVLLFGGVVIAQATIPKIDVLLSQPKIDTSIIREWNDNLAVMYSQSSASGNWFHLVDASSNTVFSAKTDNTVTDMEILDDLVFYCGNNNVGLPIIGYFPVNDLTTPILYENINYYLPTSFSVRPKRLEVFASSTACMPLWYATTNTPPTPSGDSLPISCLTTH